MSFSLPQEEIDAINRRYQEKIEKEKRLRREENSTVIIGSTTTGNANETDHRTYTGSMGDNVEGPMFILNDNDYGVKFNPVVTTSTVSSNTRYFNTGATRDTDNGKFDYEGFLSPVVLERYAAYMHSHRMQSDGKMRDSDNWQKGMTPDVYMKSMWRHFLDVWKLHRANGSADEMEKALCALMFNVQGYLFEVTK